MLPQEIAIFTSAALRLLFGLVFLHEVDDHTANRRGYHHDQHQTHGATVAVHRGDDGHRSHRRHHDHGGDDDVQERTLTARCTRRGLDFYFFDRSFRYQAR